MPRVFKNSNRSLISIILSLALISCQTQKKFENNLSSGDCDQALVNIPENQSTVKFLDSTKSEAGKVLSYSVTGAGYVTQAVLTVTGGVVIALALCAPMIAVAAAGGGIPAAPSCFTTSDIFNSDVKSPALGKGARESTKHWGCPNIAPLAHSVQKVAACYLNKGGQENLKKAEASLKSLKNSDAFFDCLSTDIQAQIEENINDIHKAML